MTSVAIPQLETASDPRAGNGTFVLIAFFAAALFFISSHDIYVSVKTDFTATGEQAAESVSTGSAARKVAMLALGAGGLVMLVRARGQAANFTNPLALLVLFYVAYCVASVAWSQAPSLTVKRAAVLLLCSTAVVGVSRQLGRLDLIRFAMVTTGSFLIIGVLSEVAVGTFRPWESDYRFAGTVHPNSQGQFCAVFCLATFFCLRLNQGKGLFLKVAFLAGLTLLLLAKSRTSCGCLFVGMSVAWLPWARMDKKLALAIGIPLLLLLLGFLGGLAGFNIENKFAQILTLGRGDQVGSFTGRLPLWGRLTPYLIDAPVLGHGYLSFWTPQNIEYVSSIYQWTIPDAHNEYLDTLLNLGAVGFLLLGSCLTLYLFQSGRAYLLHGDQGYGFAFAMLTYALAGALFESGFAQPLGLVGFISACGLAQTAFFPTTAKSRPAREHESTRQHESARVASESN